MQDMKQHLFQISAIVVVAYHHDTTIYICTSKSSLHLLYSSKTVHSKWIGRDTNASTADFLHTGEGLLSQQI